MKNRWFEFVENCKDAVKEVAPVFGFIALLFAGAILLAFWADVSKEKEKPTPEPAATVATIAVATPQPTPEPEPTPESTLEPLPIEQNLLIRKKNPEWRTEATAYAKEYLPQNYTDLVYEYYSLLEDYDNSVCDVENLESFALV